MVSNVRGYVHVACLGEWRKIAEELFTAITDSGLLSASDRVSVVKVGHGDLTPPPGFDLVEDARLHLLEYPTLSLAWDASEHEGVSWYVHTKGASWTAARWLSRDNPWRQDVADYPTFLRNVTQWRRFMTYFVVHRHRECLASLAHYDTCGVAYRANPSPHYSGNFWWARNDYLRRLENPETLRLRLSDGRGGEKSMSELWVGTGNPRAKDLFPNRSNLYRWGLSPEVYRGQITLL